MPKKKKKKKTEAPEAPKPTVTPPRARRVFFWCLAGAFLTALFLRFYDLERKPLHHDEGVNSFFLLNLKKDFPAGWKYDPENYHGPFLFLTESIPLAISETAFSMRFLVAVFGSLLLLLLWPLRRRVGYAGVAAAAFLLAISPSNLFFARTNIHETFLIFFTLGTVAAAVRLRETRKARYLILAAACWALVIANKETYVMTAAAFVAALALCWYLLRRPKVGETAPGTVAREMLDWGKTNLFWLGMAAGVFVFLIAIYYSSLFTNLKGTTSDLINSLLIWQKTGTKGAGHEKPWIYFFQLLYRFELPITILSLGGIYFALVRRNVFMIFTAAWAVLLLAIYSGINYKTPWLALNFILPMAILAGYLVENVYQVLRSSRMASAVGGAVFAAVLAGWLGAQSWVVNFEEYDDDKHMIVYSQTRRDTKDLVRAIEDYARDQAQGEKTKINVITDEYWPLNWHLRNYEHAAYWGKVIPDSDAPIVIGRTRMQSELEAALKDTYISEMYSLRPGVDLILYLRQHRGKTPEEELRGDQPVAGLDTTGLFPGLVAHYYPKISPIGEPVRSTVEDRVYFRCNNDEEKIARLGMKAPLSIVWEGLIRIDREGIYSFATESDDGSWVFIDNKLVVDNGGTHGNQYVSGEIELTPGYHRIRVKYFDSAWGAWMKLLWTPVGGGEEEIPAEVLSHRRGGADS